MSPSFYYVLHIIGIAMIFLGYGALIVRALLDVESRPVRKLGAITSGVGLLVVLVAGFGLQAKLGYGFPPWLVIKLLAWLGLGLLIMLINRQPRQARLWWSLSLLLGATAAFMVYYGRTMPALSSW